MPNLTVGVTCYNERNSITLTLDSLLSALDGCDLSWEAIVVDDVSVDDSVAVVERYIAEEGSGRIRLYRNQRNQGLVRNVYMAAEMGTGRYFWYMSGDNTVPAEAAGKILASIGRADIVIPKVLTYVGRPLHRKFISRAYTLLVNFLSGLDIYYYNGSSVYQRADVVRYGKQLGGYGYSAEMIIRLVDDGRSYVEVPVEYTDRKEGKASALRFPHLVQVSGFFGRLMARRLRRVFGVHHRETAGREANPRAPSLGRSADER
jgi:glycosyltransferase involved in cell wall biosynthesis